MREEFHWEEGKGYKQKYGWETLTANVWLPSMCELIGYDPTSYYEPAGVYYSAMQGLNASGNWYVDAQGGEQLAYFKQYNASGGGEKLWAACNQEQAWTRSTSLWVATSVWRTTSAQRMDTLAVTGSRAVHPAAGDRPVYCFAGEGGIRIDMEHRQRKPAAQHLFG